MMEERKKATSRMNLGRKGEEAAARFLAAKGQTVIGKNCRKGHLEIDLVTVDALGVHFVEVKSRTAPCAAPPEEAVGPLKQRRLARAAGRYLARSEDPRIPPDAEVHFDVVAVTFDGASTDIAWFPDAFFPLYV